MQTIVLSGTGPHLKVKSGKTNTQIIVIGKTSAKTINLTKSTEVKFAA